MLGNILLLIGGLSWTIVYIEIIRKGFKEKTCGMPLFPLMLNFSWEVIYSVDGLLVRKSFDSIQTYVDVVWALLDVCIIFTWFEYGKRLLSTNNKKFFIPYSLLALFTSFAMQYAFYLCPEAQGLSAMYSAYTSNTAMSISFLIMILRKENTQGQSLIVAIGKWIGSLAFVLYGNVYSGIHVFILLMGIVCSLFDVLYIYFLVKLKYYRESNHG